MKNQRRAVGHVCDRIGFVLDERGDLRGELSMGMTHDYEIAIAEGATIVRVGTAIFGERKKV